MASVSTFGPFTVVHQRPSAAARETIAGLFDYRELGASRNIQRAPAPMTVPLVFSLGTPFDIRCAGGASRASTIAPDGFVSRLRPEATDIASDGRACVVQVDLTPLGAYRLLGPAMPELPEPVCALDQLLGPPARRLLERLRDTQDAHARLDLVERFVLEHSRWVPSGEITHACRRLAQSPDGPSIAGLSREIGWSHKHFVHRFKAETGVTPKAFMRMLRFHRACALARQAARPHWTGIAAAAGYCDQSHMNHDFLALAGEPPGRWMARAAGRPPQFAG